MLMRRTIRGAWFYQAIMSARNSRLACFYGSRPFPVDCNHDEPSRQASTEQVRKWMRPNCAAISIKPTASDVRMANVRSTAKGTR